MLRRRTLWPTRRRLPWPQRPRFRWPVAPSNILIAPTYPTLTLPTDCGCCGGCTCGGYAFPGTLFASLSGCSTGTVSLTKYYDQDTGGSSGPGAAYVGRYSLFTGEANCGCNCLTVQIFCCQATAGRWIVKAQFNGGDTLNGQNVCDPADATNWRDCYSPSGSIEIGAAPSPIDVSFTLTSIAGTGCCVGSNTMGIHITE